MMKMRVVLAFASLVVFSLARAHADDGEISAQALAKMGLMPLKAMTDDDGLEIRGMGRFAIPGGETTWNGGNWNRDGRHDGKHDEGARRHGHHQQVCQTHHPHHPTHHCHPAHQCNSCGHHSSCNTHACHTCHPNVCHITCNTVHGGRG